jgi:hypothetical protein
VKKIMYPVDRCVSYKDNSAEDCGLLFAYDPGFVHTLIFMSATLEDFIMGRPASRTTLFHSQHALAHLRTALSDPDEHVGDATFLVVLSLTLVASIIGDGQALELHLAGLKRLVLLRGGVDHRLKFKIFRMYLAAYMNSGSVLRLVSGPVPWDTGLDSASASPEHAHDTELYHHIRDIRLTTVAKELKCFASVMTKHVSPHDRMDLQAFNNTLDSVQSRLLFLENQRLSATDECIRLAAIAILSTTLQLPRRKASASHFRARYQKSCQQLWAADHGRHGLVFWALMVGLVSVFEPHEPWLLHIWRELPISWLSWSEATTTLQKHIWIGFLHDELGEKAFASCQSTSGGYRC